LKTPPNPAASITGFTMFCTAIAHSGVSGLGFQIIVSPQTAAMNAFHDTLPPGS